MRDLPRAHFFSNPREHNFSDEVEGSDDEGCALGVWRRLGGLSGFTVDSTGQIHGDEESWVKIIDVRKSGSDKEKLSWAKTLKRCPLDPADSFERSTRLECSLRRALQRLDGRRRACFIILSD